MRPRGLVRSEGVGEVRGKAAHIDELAAGRVAREQYG